MKSQLTPSDLDTVHKLYRCLLKEVDHAGYTPRELALLHDVHLYYGRYLDGSLRNYFLQTVVPNIADAVSYFRLGARPHQQLFDLGCGLGMQSLIFAAYGARVVAVDIGKDPIELCKKRKIYYQEELGRELKIEFQHCDFRQSRADDFGCKFDGLFSMSAFSYINPVDRTAQLVSSILDDEAKLFLYEKNASCLFNSFGKREDIPSPADTVEAFRSHSFDTDFLYGGCSLPSMFWSSPSLNGPIVHPVNNLLRKKLALSFSYVLGMRRGRRPLAAG